MSTPNKRFGWWRLALGIAVFAGVLAYWLPSWRDVWANVNLDPLALGLGFLASTVSAVVTSARWQVMVETMGGTRLPYRVYLHTFLLTKVLGQVSSTLVMDLLGRGVLLRSAGSTRGVGHTMTQAVLERIFDIVLPVLMIGWAFVYLHPDATNTVRLSLFAGVCLVFVAVAGRSLRPLSRIALAIYRRVRPPAPGEPGDQVPTISRSLATGVGLLSLARYLAVITQFWLVATAVGIDLPVLAMAAATPIAQLASAVGITPGALGIQEAGWAGALQWVGAPAAVIALFILSQRVIISSYFLLLALVTRPFVPVPSVPNELDSPSEKFASTNK
ncbi:MAG: lysylphosphatidylglycerol synthase transmembrane domain-containing protein [Nannocystaceae bacterium]